MEKKKTFTEVWKEDLRDALLIKVTTNAKNLPEVWHKAIQLLKQEVEQKWNNNGTKVEQFNKEVEQ